MTTIRRLAAILAADIAGYSRLMSADEEGTIAAFRDSLSGSLRCWGMPRWGGRSSE